MAPIINFKKNTIYELKIDFYKTGQFDGEGFYEYGLIEPLEGNKYKIYSYYMLDNKFNPTKPTRDGKYTIIEFMGKAKSGDYIFKPPVFTEGPKKGGFDYWYMKVRNGKIAVSKKIN